jgi:hypothetical protein
MGARRFSSPFGAGLQTPPEFRSARVSRPRPKAPRCARFSPDPAGGRHPALGAGLSTPPGGATQRSARVSRPRRGTRPTGLPRLPQTPASKVFVLAKLIPKEGDLSVMDLGRGRETRAQRGGVRAGRETRAQRAALGRGQELLPLPVLPGNWDMVRVHMDHIPIQETLAQQAMKTILPTVRSGRFDSVARFGRRG